MIGEPASRNGGSGRLKKALLALAAVAFAWGALWLARPASEPVPASARTPGETVTPEASLLGEPPDKVGSLYLCQHGERIRAYSNEMHYYPTNHPLLPPQTVQPARCFRTTADAEAAGYTLALPPRDGALIAGIYLVRAGDEVDQECITAAFQLGFRVPCPTLLPWTGTDLSIDLCGFDKPIDVCVEQNAFTLNEEGFALAAGHELPFLPHLLMVALKSGDPVRDPEFERDLLCPDGEQVGTDTVRAQNSDQELPAVYIDCPLAGPPPMAGHLILRWTDGGVVYEVSLHGNTEENVLLLQTIAANLQVVGPPGR